MHKFTLFVSPRAEKDLRTIWQYSVEKWGQEQAEAYLDTIEQAFMGLLEFPKKGQARPDVLPESMAWLVGQHLIFYCIDGTVVNILGVPHQQMDIPSHLQG